MLSDKVCFNLISYLNTKNINKCILAISGGIDSIVLLHVLLKIKDQFNLDIVLFHINYNMNQNSSNSELLCRKLGEDTKNNIVIKNIKLSNKNFESNAREYRYNHINDYAKENNINYIFTAHHMDDQIETLYMKYQDNSDWVSKIGIREKYDKIIRPMLNVSKKEIIDYAKKNQLKWIEDLSNYDTKYRRNNVRINVLPKIMKKNPIFIKNLIKNSNQNKIKIGKLKLVNKINRLRYIQNKKFAFVSILNDIHKSIDIIELKLFYQSICLKMFNRKINKSRKYWVSLHLFLLNAKTGSIFIINKELTIMKDRSIHYLYLNHYIKPQTQKLNKSNIKWYDTNFIVDNKKYNNQTKTSIATFYLPRKYYKEGLLIRNWKYGDKAYHNNRSISLKKIFIKNKISLFDKFIYPVIVNKMDEIINVPNLYSPFNNNSKNITVNWYGC